PPADDDFADEGDDLPPPPADDGFADEGDDLPPPPADDGFEEEEEFAAPPPPEEEEIAEEPTPEPTKKAVARIPSDKIRNYSVKSGDSLWRISGRKKVYSNPFQWPLLFKANKAKIEDPDLIYPRQSFDVKHNYSSSEIRDAVKKAKETPPYVPHTLPRKKLPVKY
ncbi:MAG: LysM peptidoglycan-binding domain-containing protein, partial [Candidatus Goldiibacteriota bacterium]